MPDYKESSLSGTEWQRCNVVVVTNPLGGKPKIAFEEERVFSVGGRVIKEGIGGCLKAFAPDGAFPLLYPATNLPTGMSMTHTELYVALYSLYMQTAMERDAAGAD
jgi:hypothetical protein